MSFPMIKYMMELEQVMRSAKKSKTLLTHCFGYSLDLAVKDVTSNCEILGDGVGTVKEITVLVKFSPKREKMLGSLIENVEGVEENKLLAIKASIWMNYVQRAGRLKQSVFKRLSLIIATYKCLAEILTGEVRARIVGRQGQMITFDFYFGLSLGQTFYNFTL